jgi:hypothetical protein
MNNKTKFSLTLSIINYSIVGIIIILLFTIGKSSEIWFVLTLLSFVYYIGTEGNFGFSFIISLIIIFSSIYGIITERKKIINIFCILLSIIYILCVIIFIIK